MGILKIQKVGWHSPVVWLVVWVCAQVVIRLTTVPALELDEAEQMLWSQDLLSGYGAQPPLYTWLQWAMNQAFGPSIVSLTLLKIGLIALTYVFFGLAAREVLPFRTAWWAAASLSFFPQMGWESLRDLTHTVLMTCMVAATWLILIRQIKRPDPFGFVLLGLVLALGLLSKYSFSLFAVAALVAALSLPEARRSLLSKGWWWSPLVGMAVLAPHAIWLSKNWAHASTSTLGKMEISPEIQPILGLEHLGTAIAANIALWVVLLLGVFGAALWRSSASSNTAPQHSWASALFVRYGLALLTLLLGMIFFGHVTQFKDRWIYPLLSVLPLAVLTVRPALLSHHRAKLFTFVIAAGWLLLTLLVAGRSWATGQLGKRDEINEPINAFVTQLRAAGYDGQMPILVNEGVIGGMLRIYFPNTRITVCGAQNNVCAEHVTNQYLRVARRSAPTEPWWTAADPPLSVTRLELPYVHAKPGGPVMQYYFIWPSNITSGNDRPAARQIKAPDS